MDKKSVSYFMTEMTQEEFDQITNGKEVKMYEFNKIKRINGIDKENGSGLEEK